MLRKQATLEISAGSIIDQHEQKEVPSAMDTAFLLKKIADLTGDSEKLPAGSIKAITDGYKRGKALSAMDIAFLHRNLADLTGDSERLPIGDLRYLPIATRYQVAEILELSKVENSVEVNLELADLSSKLRREEKLGEDEIALVTKILDHTNTPQEKLPKAYKISELRDFLDTKKGMDRLEGRQSPLNTPDYQTELKNLEEARQFRAIFKLIIKIRTGESSMNHPAYLTQIKRMVAIAMIRKLSAKAYASDIPELTQIVAQNYLEELAKSFDTFSISIVSFIGGVWNRKMKDNQIPLEDLKKQIVSGGIPESSVVMAFLRSKIGTSSEAKIDSEKLKMITEYLEGMIKKIGMIATLYESKINEAQQLNGPMNESEIDLTKYKEKLVQMRGIQTFLKHLFEYFNPTIQASEEVESEVAA